MLARTLIRWKRCPACCDGLVVSTPPVLCGFQVLIEYKFYPYCHFTEFLELRGGKWHTFPGDGYGWTWCPPLHLLVTSVTMRGPQKQGRIIGNRSMRIISCDHPFRVSSHRNALKVQDQSIVLCNRISIF